MFKFEIEVNLNGFGCCKEVRERSGVGFIEVVFGLVWGVVLLYGIEFEFEYFRDCFSLVIGIKV